MGRRNLIIVILALAMVSFMFLPVFSATLTTIEGVVNSQYEIVTDDDEAYYVEEGDKGDEVIDLIGKRVRAMGMIDEKQGIKSIKVTSYEVVEE